MASDGSGLRIETADFRQWAVSHSVGTRTAVYRAHVTRRAGNLLFGSRVHARLIPHVACLARELGIGETSVLVRRGRGGLDPTFVRVAEVNLEGHSIAIVAGNLGRTYRLQNAEFERRGETVRVVPFTIVYHSELRWSDQTLVSTDPLPVYRPAMLAILAHELLHVRFPDRPEQEIKALTWPLLRDNLDTRRSRE